MIGWGFFCCCGGFLGFFVFWVFFILFWFVCFCCLVGFFGVGVLFGGVFLNSSLEQR